jgi:hypothetical protein
VSQTDIFGTPPPVAREFKDIRNWRPSVAEDKAELALVLGALLNKVPPSVVAGSVQVVRQWREAREKAVKVAGSSRSSVQQLQSAISDMGRFK